MAQRVSALDQIRAEIEGATKTMTSVPKPLKFLSPHYPTLKELYDKQTDAGVKVREIEILRKPLTKFSSFVIGSVCRPLFSDRHGGI